MNLYREQKESLFKNINLLADPDIVKKSVYYEESKRRILEASPESFMLRDQRISLKKTLRKQYDSEEKVEEKLKEIFESIRKAELTKLEKTIG